MHEACQQIDLEALVAGELRVRGTDDCVEAGSSAASPPHTAMCPGAVAAAPLAKAAPTEGGAAAHSHRMMMGGAESHRRRSLLSWARLSGWTMPQGPTASVIRAAVAARQGGYCLKAEQLT